MNVSVAMTSYNGEKYIKEQILSIVSQFDADDELIISDDGSTDGTVALVKSLSRDYPQIKLIDGPHKGVFLNFEHAIMNCGNEIIFLSDQDDLWIDGKVRTIKELFIGKPDVNLIMHRAYRMIDDDKTDQMMVPYRKGFWKNLVKSCYWGCCMAMRADYIKQYVPFHVDGVAHDQLIGLLAEKDKCVYYEEKPLCYHRFHNNNQTKRRTLWKRISFRFLLLRDFLVCNSYKHKEL